MSNFYTDNESLAFYLSHPDMPQTVALKEQNFEDSGRYSDAPATTEEGLDHYKRIMELVGDIAANTIAPNAADVDVEGPKLIDGCVHYAKGTEANHKALCDAGLYGISLPRKYKGLNLGYVPYVMSAEIISRADAGFANIWGLQECAETINEFASEEIKARFLPRIHSGATCSMDLTEPDAGSDLQSVRLKATWDEVANCWRLNGVKRFITNGDADIHLVLARSEEGTADGRGLSYFVFDRNDGGLTVRRLENKMGIKGSPTAELVFHNAPAQIVGDRRLGLIKYVMALMNGARLGVGAQSVGLSEAAYREAVDYAAHREQFGTTIDHFLPVRELLQSMRTKTDAARSLLYETARYVDLAKSYEAIASKRPVSPEERKAMRRAQNYANGLTPIVKLMSSEFANQVAYDCIQVHGGSGFMKEYTCERLYRDARILPIYEGTSQLQVVSAVKGIRNGSYQKMLEEYAETAASAIASYQGNSEAMQHLLSRLQAMTISYVNMCEVVTAGNEMVSERCLAESFAYIVMGYLLLFDSMRDVRFFESCTHIVRMGRGEIARHTAMLESE